MQSHVSDAVVDAEADHDEDALLLPVSDPDGVHERLPVPLHVRLLLAMCVAVLD